MSLTLRSITKVLLLLALSTILLITTITWFAAGEIVHPPRRPIQDYHRTILDHPSAHGLAITAFEVPPFAPYRHPTPALLCEPNPGAPLGQRGLTIRKQLTAQGTVLAPFGQRRPTLILLHGRKGRKEDNLPIAERFCAVGFRCVIIDLPAHGENLNPIASYGLHEWSIPDQVASYAAKRFHYPPFPRGLWGISQGGAVAIQAAAKTPWNALMVTSSFARFEDICHGQAKRLFGYASRPMFQVLKSMVEYRGGYRLGDIIPISSASQITIPTFIGHGSNDTLIPSTIGQELFQTIPATQKHWCLIESGTHERVLVTPKPLYAEMATFFLAHLAQTTAPSNTPPANLAIPHTSFP